MTLTVELDPDSVSVNHDAECLGQRSHRWYTDRQTHTHRTYCSIRTTEVIGKNYQIDKTEESVRNALADFTHCHL